MEKVEEMLGLDNFGLQPTQGSANGEIEMHL